MDFFEAYRDDIVAFFQAVIDFVKAFIGYLNGGNAEKDGESTSATE